MQVQELMAKPLATCNPDTNLAAAVEILWNRDCGILPIVDANGKVVGVITDRDICVALGTQNRLPSQVTAKEITSGRIYGCRPEDDVRKALALMAETRVRRLLVLDAQGHPQGIISMDDIVLHTETSHSRKNSGLSAAEVVSTLKVVFAPTHDRERTPESKRSFAVA